ncbi:MAG: hypothetical protein HC851_07065 [Acaryochloris sp. RU_4_1]|nr:hypothetical protein [Acaryochloris sp. RU_4_1]NJR53313.1 hypothetical protein [Acaryochloris sp. CRU_2_0]
MKYIELIPLKLSNRSDPLQFVHLHEPPGASPHTGWCGMGGLKALLEPIRQGRKAHENSVASDAIALPYRDSVGNGGGWKGMPPTRAIALFLTGLNHKPFIVVGHPLADEVDLLPIAVERSG